MRGTSQRQLTPGTPSLNSQCRAAGAPMHCCLPQPRPQRGRPGVHLCLFCVQRSLQVGAGACMAAAALATALTTRPPGNAAPAPSGATPTASPPFAAWRCWVSWSCTPACAPSTCPPSRPTRSGPSSELALEAPGLAVLPWTAVAHQDLPPCWLAADLSVFEGVAPHMQTLAIRPRPGSQPDGCVWA